MRASFCATLLIVQSLKQLQLRFSRCTVCSWSEKQKLGGHEILWWGLNINILHWRGFQRNSHRLFSLVFLFLSQWKPVRDAFTCQRLACEGQGLWEVWRWKDNKRLTVVLYFFLLRDAPHSPAVLIGSGEQPCKGRADVNRVWRTSAAGTNIPASLSPFVHPPYSALHLPDLSVKH